MARIPKGAPMSERRGSRRSPSTGGPSRRSSSTASPARRRGTATAEPRARRSPRSSPAPGRAWRGDPARHPAAGRARSGRGRSGRTGRRRGGDPRSRSLALLVGLVVLFGVAVVRLGYVQVVGADRYVHYGREQRIEPIELAGGRGTIFDRNGDDLAISIPQTTIAADPSVIADPAGAARRLAPVLGLDEAQLRRDLTGPGRFVYLARQVDDDVADRVGALDIDGVLLFDEQKRFNPAGDLGRSLIGQVGVDHAGLSGIEQSMDDELAGRSGLLVVERDMEGRTIPAGRHQIDPAVPGDDIVLTLDSGLQYQVENILAAQVAATGAQGGSAIVSDPETGEILSLANVALDPATGVVGNTSNDVAVTANYEPGSVNKVITLSAALDEGVVTPDQVIHVPSQLQVADHTYTDAHPGDLTVTDVVAKSSNVGTIKIAQQLGKERLDEYLRRFGFGRSTGLGLPHEESGALLDPDDWSGTSIGSIPIGQGISVTAMQMLFAYNVIANDGVYVPPRLVKATVDENGDRHETAPGQGRRVVSPTTASQMRAMLSQVISSGTGKAAAIDGYDAAGKTGTARKPQPIGGYRDEAGNYHYISTFAGFVPADDPKLSIIVVIDEPTTSPYAGTVAAPAFAEIGRHALRLMGVAPAATPAAAPLAVEAPSGRVRSQPAASPTTAPPTTVPGTPAPTDTTVSGQPAVADGTTPPAPDPAALPPPAPAGG
jgi:cell division protein FtsI (penicillin-binding protein 3)